jgi:AraC-like DNA-binding protein
MSAAEDHFSAFLRTLTESLAGPSEDSWADGEEVARRIHLSRFHLDRIVRAISGEAPAAFRRRVLLERAAYRLLTTQARILDVGLEAGYASHEGFARAFTRAYGVGPQRWRRHPGQIRLEAPSGVHFHPPGSIRLPAQRKVTTMDLLISMVEHHIWLTGEMIGASAELSEDRLDRPIELSVDEDRQSIRTLLSRLVGQMGMWNAALADRDYDWSVEEHESLESMRERLADEGPRFLSHVREVVEDGRLDDTFVDALCEPAEVFTFGGMIAHVLTFAAHRRTLVALALDDAGVGHLGWGDPMRWVARPRE